MGKQPHERAGEVSTTVRAGEDHPLGRRLRGRPLQVLVIGCGNTLCTRDVTLGLVRGLREIGVAVDFYDTLAEGRSGELTLVPRADGADAAVVIHGRRIPAALVARIRGIDTPAVLWATDDPHEIDDSARYGRNYDFVLTVERHAVAVHGEDRSAWLPTAVDPTVYRPWNELPARSSDGRLQKADASTCADYRQEILVAGSLYPERLLFLSEIGDWLLTKNVRLIGPKRGSWEHAGLARIHEARCLTTEEMARYVAGSQVVLDVPRDPRRSAFGRTNQRGVAASGCGPRCFQVPAAGALLATSSERTDIFEHFHAGDVLIYDSPRDFTARAERLLSDPEGRSAMVARSRETVLSRHTYAARARALVEILEERMLPRARRRVTIAQTAGDAAAPCKNSAAFSC